MHPTTPKPKRVTKKAVLKAIVAKFGSVTAYALSLNLTRNHVSKVIHGRVVSAQVAASAAALADARPHQVWPRLYAPDGGPRFTYHRRAS